MIDTQRDRLFVAVISRGKELVLYNTRCTNLKDVIVSKQANHEKAGLSEVVRLTEANSRAAASAVRDMESELVV